jgi:hypothetical protein
MLRSFSQLALSAKGISIRIPQWLDGVITPLGTPKECLKIWSYCQKIYLSDSKIVKVIEHSITHRQTVASKDETWAGFSTIDVVVCAHSSVRA